MSDDVRVEVDCRSMVCPMPVIRLGRAIESVAPGEVVVLIADDPAAAVDVAAFCRLMGHELVETTPSSDATRYAVRRGPSQRAASSAASSP
jgi:tRNA 2-thiouridine synthesizing protein A